MRVAPYPLKPSFREKVWGVHDLQPWFPPTGQKIGEVWFLHPEGDPLPILVKFIFTSERLSVQVHPDDAYALAHDGTLGKTEMWYILRAEPGAKLALGFREPVSRTRAWEAALSGEIEQLLRWFEVKPGQIFFIPPGTVHALGEGIVLCEIQENTDITYRLYDYGRPRELHLDKALDVACLGPHPGPSVAQGRILAACDYFVTEKLDLDSGTVYEPERDRFHLLVVLEGQGRWAGQEFRMGQVWMIPAAAEPFCIETDGARLLKSYLPRK
ncbi:MAG: class I mannose-6-phosphate isomerase [Bryobacterales bacterium]|nr:class I mannose-6-phosphate isomerase [Bryobacteraceae bacterium]MDW8353133.1 class I mannose-6-phosphate isomerase [Bryobacterales bacterium]